MTTDPSQIVIFVGIITALQALDQPSRHQADGFAHRLVGLHYFWHDDSVDRGLLAYAPTHEWSRLWTFTNYSGDAGGGVWPQSDSLLYLFALSLLAADLHDHRL